MKKTGNANTTLRIGMYKGRSLADVWAEDSGYLCWFYETVEGCETVKQAIASLPRFAARLTAWKEKRELKDKTLEQRIEQVVAKMFAVQPTPAELDSLCDHLFCPEG
jgi:hypothetical protein